MDMEAMGSATAMTGWRIYWKSATGSTNVDAREGVHGDVYVADFQTSGRGRLDHRWLAPAGVNLTFSAVLDVSGMPPEEVATMPLVAGLAVARTANRILEGRSARLTVKWPNDVLVDGRKLAGILCERNGDVAIIGIGVNVNQTSFPPEIAGKAVSLASVTGGRFERDEVLERILDELSNLHLRWRKDGFAPLCGDISGFDHLRGRMVSVMQTDADQRPVTGLCGGIQPDGTLLVGATRIYAGEAHVMQQASQPDR